MKFATWMNLNKMKNDDSKTVVVVSKYHLNQHHVSHNYQNHGLVNKELFDKANIIINIPSLQYDDYIIIYYPYLSLQKRSVTIFL